MKKGRSWLPTCFRRLFGAVVVDMLGPIIEPLLSQDQAAKKGGDMGQNISRVFAHLGGSGERIQQPTEPRLWEAVLGSASGIGAVHDDLRDHELDACPAVILADQSKAFERVSIPWLIAVLDGWRLPRWAMAALLALVVGRAVLFLFHGWLGPRRPIRRGFGMGGTASLFLWDVAYDPIVYGMRAVVGADAPTFVDDLAALVRGPRQAAMAQLFLWVAGHCAGLLTESHHCGAVCFNADQRVARRAMDGFPLTVNCCDGVVEVSGANCGLLYNMVTRLLGDAASGAVIRQGPCQCSAKTIVIPAYAMTAWREALAGSLMGSSAVVAVGRYLGVYVATRALGNEASPPYGQWGPDSERLMAFRTWDRHISKM